MLLEISYNDDSQELVKQLEKELQKFTNVEFKSYHEGLFKERKKAFKLKGGFSARRTPFAVLVNNDSEPVIAFYSEANTCTIDEILKALNNYAVYDKKE